MRLIKHQTTNNRSIYSYGYNFDIDRKASIDSEVTLLLPKGTFGERPVPVNGMVRYSITDNEFEFYQNGAWRKVRFKEPNSVGIVQQNLGTGDATETVFGPLDSGDSDYPVPAAAQNILVLVENVLQISTTNYTLEQSISGNLTGPNSPYVDGWYVKFTSPVDLGKDVTVLHNFDK